jgi:anaerobic selenocysteine-containing dehydrogenase
VSRANKVQDREPLLIHPDDAAARGIADGAVVRVCNERGACLAGVRVTDAIRPGVVQLATGAWYDPEVPGHAAAGDGVRPAGRDSRHRGIVIRRAVSSVPPEVPMSDPVDALVVDLLEWIGREPKRYAEVIQAWRTTCPRLPVWEEANARGLLQQVHEPGSAALVGLSPRGLALLEARRRPTSSA